MSIQITEAAAKQIHRVIGQQQLDPAKVVLRLGLDPSTPGGGTMDLSVREEPDDHRLDQHGLAVRCDPRTYVRLDGTTIDYREEAHAAGFTFRRPASADAPAYTLDPPWLDEALHRVIDPEVGINIVDLGLIYGVDVADNAITVRMTMTTPACPMSEMIQANVRTEIQRAHPALPGIAPIHVDVEIGWDPLWSSARMSPAARKMMGWK